MTHPDRCSCQFLSAVSGTIAVVSTSSRTLQLLSLLQTHRHWTGADLADRLEVSVRTLRRDVDRLRELGYPVRASRGADGGYQLAPGASLPPLVLDDEEAVALALGLQAATASPVAGMAEAGVRALAKVAGVLPQRLRRRVDALSAVTVPAGWGRPVDVVDPRVLTTLAQAGRDAERLVFGYTAADGRASDRHVEPHRLLSAGRRWYLVAWDLDRGDWRSFRLDRVTGPHPTGARFAPRALPAEDLASFVLDRAPAPVSHAVEVHVQAPADRVARRTGRWATVTALDEDSCRLEMTTDSLDWAGFTVAVVGEPFTVVAPPELSGLLDRWARLIDAAGTPPAPTPEVGAGGATAARTMSAMPTRPHPA